MTGLTEYLGDKTNVQELDKVKLLDRIAEKLETAGFTVVDRDDSRPWGGFLRLDSADGDKFIQEFFPQLDHVVARLGNPEAELSPKILLVEPEQRLSWQRHRRRAERWLFLSEGGYHKSRDPDNMGEMIRAKCGDEVQFDAGECHRLVGGDGAVTLVAEIWQHTDGLHPSDETDIERLQDDYNR